MKFRIKVFTYDDVFEYIVEAENKSKARYKAFKDAKASGDFAPVLTFGQFLNLFRPDVEPIYEIDLLCSHCGTRVLHENAADFIEEGWRNYGSAAYCPKCVGICKNMLTDKYSMALFLLDKLSKRRF